MASSKFTQSVEAYLADLRLVRASGGARGEPVEGGRTIRGEQCPA